MLFLACAFSLAVLTELVRFSSVLGLVNQPYERQELLEAYEAFGVNDHVVQNEFELFRHAESTHGNLRSLLEKELGGRSRKLWHDTYEITEITPREINSEEMVTVSYKNSYPERGDWIGAYSPPVSSLEELSSTVPVKFGWCDDGNIEYDKTGTGSLRFNLTNLRADVSFHVFSGGFRHMTLRNTSSMTVSFKDNNEQLRPRVLPTGDPDVYQVVWSSDYTTTRPVMKWAWIPEGLGTELEHVAVTDRVLKEELCGWPANNHGWRDLGQINKANMTGMLAASNQKIYYTFGDADSSTWSSKVWEFHVPPKAGDQPPDRPTTVVLFDDLGRGSNDDAWTWYHYGAASFNTTKSVGHRVAQGEIDAIYHGGDISYAVGYEAVWDFFLAMLTPMSASTLYFTTVGNHESDFPNTTAYYQGYDSGGECSVPTMKLLPQPAPATKDSPWWSYDVGLIHFVGMSTEHNYTRGSAQWRFLEADLAGVDRSKTPWIIFGGHRSMYINSAYGPIVDGHYKASSDLAVSELMIEHIEPLLWKYKVNLGFYGHMHSVQRQSAVLDHHVVQKSEPRADTEGNMWNWHDDPQAPVQMVIGTGGANLMDWYADPVPDWNEMTMAKWGYAIVKAHNSSFLSWEWVDSSNDEILDRMVITQVDPSTHKGATFTCPKGFSVCGEATNVPTMAPTWEWGPQDPSHAPTPAPPTPNPTPAQCAPGMYHHWNSNSCYMCHYGKYNPGNIPECVSCPAGTYADAMGMSECKSCPGGTYAYASSEGTAACSKCPAGTFSNSHATECTACGAGFYSAYGSSECTACSAGKYADLGQPCQLCPSGTFSLGGGSTCTACDNGAFSGPGASACESCDS